MIPHRKKYVVLLVTLVASLAVQSFGAARGLWGVFSDLFATALGLAVFFVVFERPRERTGMSLVLAVVVATGWARHLLGPASLDALSIAHQGAMVVYLSVASWVILRDLFRTPVVGADNVRGAICGYLIAGAGWASVNAFTYLLVPSAYSIDPHVAGLAADWHGRLALFSYYGFAQMMTIGYADVTPVRAPATTLSLFGALFGVFYTAVVVSQLVGMAQPTRYKDADDGEA